MHIATFETPTDLFEAMFGPPQHDAHVHRRNAVKWLDEATASSKRGSAAVDQFVADYREKQAERVAEDHNYNTATIRAALDRWTSGCFDGPHYGEIRTARIRQLTRALDIAIERHALAVAAE